MKVPIGETNLELSDMKTKELHIFAETDIQFMRMNVTTQEK